MVMRKKNKSSKKVKVTKSKEPKVNQYELHFENWLQELMDKGDVIAYTPQPTTYKLYPPLTVTYSEQLKTKVKFHNWNVLRDITYTADFSFVVHKESELAKLIGDLKNDIEFVDPRDYLFFTTKKTRSGHYIVVVDVKPPSSAVQFSASLGSSRDFPIKQRILYDKQNVFINKVVPYGTANCLFAKTFTPERFYYTDKTGALRSVGKNKDKKPLYVPRLLKNWDAIKD